MLSPNNVPSRRTGRASSAWSIDSGYGPGFHEDTKLGSIFDARDITSAGAIQQPCQHIGLGIQGLKKLQLGDEVLVKQEDHSFEPSTPRLKVCTAISNPSSPDPVSPAALCEVRRSHARKSASKLPLQAVGRLNAWLDANRHHPYPNAETKQALAEACSITIKQVTTWFTNIRQRQLKTQENDTGIAGNEPNQISRQTSRKGKKKDYGRSNGASPVEGLLSPPRLSPCASMSENSSSEGDNWRCTFCGISLTAKSWRRHEETQHHPKHQWTCLAFGPRIQLPSCSSSICAFCELQNPDDDHFHDFHRIGDCLCKAEHDRTFGRPDHLQQHARNFHRCEQPLSELVRDKWRRDGPGMVDNKSWTCGFCQEMLHTWDARATHIAGHFKAGLTMAQWRDNRVLQSTLRREHAEPNESAALDILASTSATFAGPSNHGLSPAKYTCNQPMQHWQVQPASTTSIMPVATTIPDPDFDPFCVFGNGMDTFDASLTSSATYYPAASMVPAPAQNGEGSSMDFDFIGIDEFGNPLYSHGVWDRW